MARATRLYGATSVIGVFLSLGLSLWLYLDNRALRHELASRPPPPAVAARSADARTATTGIEGTTPPSVRRPKLPFAPTAAPAPPALPPVPDESRMERRARRTDEIAQLLGRLDGESEDDYKARILPLMQAGLIAPRLRVEEQRKLAQDKAHVTPEQSARLDKAFDKVYSDVIDFTNKAVADGQLSPYERNVSGWLEFAGGLGGILNEANGQVGKILEPSQVKTMYDSGFEWGEYLGLKAPWEQLKPPPVRTR
jgi:hypothetical protein